MVGENIRRFRKRATFSQEKLAERAELHPTYVSDIERGAENVSLDTLARIAKALNVQLIELVRET